MIRILSRCYDDFDEALNTVDPNHGGVLDIYIDGEIKGQHIINKPNLFIHGGRFSNDFGAYEILDDGIKRGTFRSYTLYVAADHIAFENTEIINTSKPERGQAIALMIDGDDIRMNHCFISSHQDTLFIGPLPQKEFEVGGFNGPLRDKERTIKHAQFNNCTIEGTVDFIFGSGRANFDHCTLRSLKPGYVLAPSTVDSLDYGFILTHCEFVSEMNEPCVMLARPWRDHGKALIAYSSFGPHIQNEGYDDWGRDMSCVEFKEYQNSQQSTKYVTQICDADLKKIEECINHKMED